MKKKREYSKPQVTEVKLTVMSPLLGTCHSTGALQDSLDCVSGPSYCQYP